MSFGARSSDNRNLKDAKQSQQANISPDVSDLHCFTETNGVLTTTMVDVPGYRVVKVLGAVYGLTVRSRNFAATLGMAFKSMAGGELRWFTDLVRTPLCPRTCSGGEHGGVIARRLEAPLARARC